MARAIWTGAISFGLVNVPVRMDSAVREHKLQYLGALRVRDGGIVLERMYFEDEVQPAEDIAPGKIEDSKREPETAVELIDGLSGSFDPSQYEDTYRERLCEIIRANGRASACRMTKEELIDAVRRAA